MTLLRAKNKILHFEHNPILMAILNVTPDSFSDGGKIFSPESATERALQLVRKGALVLDIGGESTRPGALECPESEELERVIPAIEAIRRVCDAVISVDTRKSAVARAAVLAGADMINDVSGGTFDSGIFAVAAETGAALCLMHSRGLPENMLAGSLTAYEDLHAEVIGFLTTQMQRAIEAGVNPDCICLDPGIGFAKNDVQNLAILRNIPQYAAAFSERPLLIGHSRKRFLRALGASDDPSERDEMTHQISRELTALRLPMILRIHRPQPLS